MSSDNQSFTNYWVGTEFFVSHVMISWLFYYQLLISGCFSDTMSWNKKVLTKSLKLNCRFLLAWTQRWRLQMSFLKHSDYHEWKQRTASDHRRSRQTIWQPDEELLSNKMLIHFLFTDRKIVQLWFQLWCKAAGDWWINCQSVIYITISNNEILMSCQ